MVRIFMDVGKILVVGLGEVGRPVYEILSESFSNVYGYDTDTRRTMCRLEEIGEKVDILHITFPFREVESFIENVVNYISMFNPKIIFIHSTVAPGTTRKIQSKTSSLVVYSPVRGKHPALRKHLRFWTKWIAAVREDALEAGKKHLEEAGFTVKIADTPESLEIAKLWETIYRAAMIACWQEIHRIARRFNASIDVIADFISEVHEVLKDRPVFYPDKIGGHCLIPNTEILSKIVKSKLLEFILESNQLRISEISDPEIVAEIEKVKSIWLKHIPRDYYMLDKDKPE
ncbi:MAG: GDP-mannose dehydrogenase [Nitrososphaerota archaeon]|nr:GDP-mannose dehydrogenase [Candidatus Geocrenenecus dongiae]